MPRFARKSGLEYNRVHRGKLIDNRTIAGERRADQVALAHGNGIRLSQDRFLVLNATLAKCKTEVGDRSRRKGFLAEDKEDGRQWQNVTESPWPSVRGWS
jgi:hypothetical protein